MQFLKTLFWVALAVILVLFATVNWHAVTLNLWGGLQADVKLPILVLFSFLAGLVPTLIVQRAKIWSLKRRMEALQRQAQAVALSVPAPAVPAPAVSAAEPRPEEERIATDSKLWPAP